jgi:hypothetical protein
VWADDGEGRIETGALGWTGRDVYVACRTAGTGSLTCGSTPVNQAAVATRSATQWTKSHVCVVRETAPVPLRSRR